MENQDILLPTNDVIFKLMFADTRNIEILTDFLKSVLSIPENEYDSLTIIDPHLKREDINDKLGILDVKITTKSGKIIHVEMQVSDVPEMPERITYYASKMIASQIGSGQHYDEIKKVISIIILVHNISKDSSSYHNLYQLYDKNTASKLTDILEIHTLELEKLPNKTDDTKKFEWLSFFNAKEEAEFVMLAKKNPSINKAVAVLKELSQDERTRILYEAREKARRDESSRLKGAFRDGEVKGKIEVAKNLLTMGMDIKQIQAATNLTEEEILNLKNNLN